MTTMTMMYEAEVLFDFGGQESGDLAVRRGDVLSVVAEYEGRWCKAERKGDGGRGRDGKEKGKGKAERKKESGLVPLPYVRRIDATQERRDTFRALYSHAARNAAELGFEEGDVLTVIDQQPGRGWWRAELRGRRGLVPANYLEACARATPPLPSPPQQQQPLLPTSSPSSPSSTSSQQQTPQQQQQQQQKPVQSGPADLKAKRLSLMLGNTGMLKAQQQQQQQQQLFAADFLDKLTMAVDGITGPGGSGKTLGRSTSTTSLIAEVNDLRYATYPFAEPDSEKNTCYKDGAFVGGNIYKVVGYLTSDATAVDEQRASEMRDFALTYKLNISAEQLLKCLVLRFEVPKNLGYSEDKIRAIQINTLTLIREWVKGCYICDVYPDEKVSGDLERFLEKVKETQEGAVRNVGIQVAQLTKLCEQQQAFAHTSPLCLAQPGDAKLLNRADICECDATEFAEQLALMEHDVLQRVTPDEFLHSAWAKKDAAAKAPNITHMTRIFNNVGHWFEESILLAPGNAERQRLLKFVIACAKACLEINELNGLMTFVCTAQSRNISRLSRIWKGKLKEDSDQLAGLVMASNFKELRKLQAERSPCIPYLAITLKDITFIDDGNSDFIPGTSLINWEKLHMLGNAIDKLVTRNGSYNNVVPNTKILAYIRNMSYTMSEDEAYKRSLEIEPKATKK